MSKIPPLLNRLVGSGLHRVHYPALKICYIGSGCRGCVVVGCGLVWGDGEEGWCVVVVDRALLFLKFFKKICVRLREIARFLPPRYCIPWTVRQRWIAVPRKDWEVTRPGQ